jgi:alpha-tubulin suppressor-like RCC1 family protein
MVPAPSPSGAFDGALSPVVTICEWVGAGCTVPLLAEFTMTTGPGSEIVRAVPLDEHYIVNWHTDLFNLDVTKTYRVRVLVAGTELGHADVDLVSGGAELKNVNTGAYIPLVGGRTLPIKFRIEEGAVFVVGPDGGTIAAGGGQVTLVVPPEALAADVGITIQPNKTFPSDPYIVAGTVFDFGPDGITFDRSAELTIKYDPANVAEGVEERSLRLHKVVGDRWEEVPRSSVNTTDKTVSGPIIGFSQYGIGLPLLWVLPLDFGNVVVGSSRVRDLIVVNVRSTTVEISSVSVFPFNPRDVFFEVVTPLPLSLAPSSGASVKLEVFPINGGFFGGDVLFSSSDGVLGLGTVSGAAPVLEVSPAFLDFGSVVPGNSAFGAFTVSNAGAGVLEGTAATTDPFAVIGGSPFSLGPGERTLVSVRFHPFIAGNFSGTVDFSANGTVILRRPVRGITPPQLNVSPAAIDFGGVPVGSSAVRKFTVSNAGGGILTGTAATSDPFAIVGGSPFNLGTGQSVDIQVSFTPSSDRRIFSGTVTFESNGGAVALPVAGTGSAAAGIVFASISASFGGFFAHTCAVTSTGTAFCWGSNQLGQLGNASATSSTTPVHVSGGLTFKSVSAQGNEIVDHTCGVTTSGAAYCWGDNRTGQLGDGTTASSTVPVVVVGGLVFTTVGAGNGHSCGIAIDGTAYCWGSNSVGQLGTGLMGGSSLTPVAVSGGLSVVALSVGNGHSCGLTGNGAAYCWGLNSWGQLGDGTRVDNPNPVAVAGGLPFKGISAGGNHSCGVTTSGAAYCWGLNAFGQIGDGSTTNSATPVPVASGLVFESISAGSVHHSCGVTTSGGAFCWGTGPALGDATTTSFTPAAVAGGLLFKSISAGDLHTCGVTTTGVAYCWGQNSDGQLGTGTTAGSSVPVKVAGQP